MEIFCPADNDDMLKMLETIWGTDRPVYLRANTRTGTYQHAPFEIGKAEVVSKGNDVTLLVYGMLFEQSDDHQGNPGKSRIKRRTPPIFAA